MSTPANSISDAHAPLLSWITALGWAGVIPFAALAATSWASPADALMQPFALGLLSAYAALALSFLGAVHWGVVLARPLHDAPLQRLALLWGVAPSLLALGCLVMPRAWGLLALALVVLLTRAMDGLLWPGYARAAQDAGWPDAARWTRLAADWLRLRTRLTAVVVLCLAAGWASAHFRA
ncbi:MAG: DUF3429 domain-containing protein [Thiomonas sp.]|uniref:DUF3429 domain-containing protein n=1 Tax=mine drainage metagenome TaxID=410659 RepID=E6PUP4_9ZZZZ